MASDSSDRNNQASGNDAVATTTTTGDTVSSVAHTVEAAAAAPPATTLTTGSNTITSTNNNNNNIKAAPQPNTTNPNYSASSTSNEWVALCQRLIGSTTTSTAPDTYGWEDSIHAAQEIIMHLDKMSTTELPLLISTLLPTVSNLMIHKTQPTPNPLAPIHKLRQIVLDWMSKLPSTEILRPYASQLVVIAMDVLTRDFEENAITASRILFDLYKTFRTLPSDQVQVYLDFVASMYRGLPTAVARNFTRDGLSMGIPTTNTTTPNSGTHSDATVTKTVCTTQANNDENAMDVQQEPSKQQQQLQPKADTAIIPMDIDKPSSASETTIIQNETTAKTAATAATTTTLTMVQKTASSDSLVTTNEGLDSSTLTTDASLLTTDIAPRKVSMKSNLSFRVLTECPLVVMLMFQLYPKFMKANIPNLIKVMMEALTLRPPKLETIVVIDPTPIESKEGTTTPSSTPTQSDTFMRRNYFAKTRDLVAAQAKTLSFLTYLLRTFASEVKPYEDRLASNVVALMTNCPRESVSTRKELLVATRHLLNSDFRAGFYRHIDSMLDERVLMGYSMSSHNNRSDPTIIRPLAYTTLSDLCQHMRTLFTMPQMVRVVCLFARVLHDESMTLPLTTQFTAVRTLLSLVDLIFHNKDPNGQLGRDMLVRLLYTLTDKLQSLVEYFPIVYKAEKTRESIEAKRHFCTESMDLDNTQQQPNGRHRDESWLLSNHVVSPDSVKDLQNMLRAIIVGQKSVIYYISNYRTQRAELTATTITAVPANTDGAVKPMVRDVPMIGKDHNDEVATASLKITQTEIAIIDRYILVALNALKLLTKAGVMAKVMDMASTIDVTTDAQFVASEKTMVEQHRDALTFFAAAFTSLDPYNLRRSLGRRLDFLIDAIVEDPVVMLVPRNLLGSNATTSFEFCNILLDYLVQRMAIIGYPKFPDVTFIDEQSDDEVNDDDFNPLNRLHTIDQRPQESDVQLKQRSATFLQLFERILKSLSVFPDNEVVVRKHLRKIVVVCLRSSMENVDNPEIYCTLLRYAFRSISAGKFEESYKELLPLIPAVLNGLHRIVYSSENALLRSTAIELCLTIPARLSSLLPHMNLLLRIIIPALNSNVGDLINLGCVIPFLK